MTVRAMLAAVMVLGAVTVGPAQVVHLHSHGQSGAGREQRADSLSGRH
jgi:hypothetical protein